MTEHESPEEQTLRAEIRSHLSQHLAPRAVEGGQVTLLGAGNDDLDSGRELLQLLGSWAVPTWPEHAGGRGLSPRLAEVYHEELATFEAPDLYPWITGLYLVGPTLLTHGTPEQQAAWLPAIRSGEEVWCQLFSEPGAGSDLAGMTCRAEPDGGGWRITGQKVWTSRAHYSRWGLLLARSDWSQPKHHGITCFAVDMQSPGVEVRTIAQMNGDRHFSEVFFDGVAIPEEQRIGEVGAGWSVALTTLEHERALIGTATPALTAEQLLRCVRESGRSEDPLVRQAAAAIVSRLEIARASTERRRAEQRAGREPSVSGPMAKLFLAQTLKRAADLAMALAGPAGTVGSSEWLTLFLTAPSMSIRGGTDEIMRNLIAERTLGLPREPSPARNQPFQAAARH